MSGQWQHTTSHVGNWLALALVLGAGILTVWLAHRVWKQPQRSRLAAALIVAPLIVGGLGALLGLIKGFGAVAGESVDPSQKARILAEGISEAINSVAFGVLLWLPAVIAAFVLTRRKPRAD